MTFGFVDYSGYTSHPSISFPTNLVETDKIRTKMGSSISTIKRGIKIKLKTWKDKIIDNILVLTKADKRSSQIST